MSTLINTDEATKQRLGKPQEKIKWAWMTFKPSKSQGTSIVEGPKRDTRFCFGSPKDKEQVQLLRQGVVDYLEIINKSLHPGKLKLLATSHLWSPNDCTDGANYHFLQEKVSQCLTMSNWHQPAEQRDLSRVNPDPDLNPDQFQDKTLDVQGLQRQPSEMLHEPLYLGGNGHYLMQCRKLHQPWGLRHCGASDRGTGGFGLMLGEPTW